MAGFLSDVFLILMIMLFLLGEGPAMMIRLRAGAGRDNPQVERLTAVGRSVVRQFGGKPGAATTSRHACVLPPGRLAANGCVVHYQSLHCG